ncbi:YwmB family TATA-box binding protein [Vallitalea pronyensis]|uniref:YwmB family TATA-box binding protein n=1 Tax=Vallitalea pronyensis TaxID=1348613 RepID=A0A8J8MFU5_9FIRM|nr:YwmB family TATA-box binding protein [Vallitalea pronyensis]QUI20870.1 YwmB family TATA-box binding protein [Vallitalea pronyensis]
MWKKLIYILCIVAILVMVNNVERVTINGEKRLLTAFNETDFELSETDLHVWGEYSKSFMTNDDMKQLGQQVASEIGLEPMYEDDFYQEELKKVYTIEKNTTEADTIIKVVELVEEVPNNGLKVENYIVVNIVLHDKCNSILYYRDKIKDTLSNYNVYATDNLTITSQHPGKLNSEAAEEIVESIAKTIGCTIKDQFLTEDIYSIYGYSKYIDGHIVSKGEKINVDLALTYNDIEDVTYLYAAIPVITIDY